MRKLFLFVLAVASAGVAFADTDTDITLTVNGTDGARKEFNIKEIKNITFSGNTMVIHQPAGDESFDIDAIEDMVFGTVSGIEGVLDADLDNGLHVNVERGILTATLADGEINVRVFDLNGRGVDFMSGRDELTYDLTALGSGTYVIVVNDKAIKFIR